MKWHALLAANDGDNVDFAIAHYYCWEVKVSRKMMRCLVNFHFLLVAALRKDTSGRSNYKGADAYEHGQWTGCDDDGGDL